MTIVFPLPIAPFHVLILPINIRIDLLKETAEQLYQALLKETLYYVYDHALDDRRKKESILIIANHLYQSVFAVDGEINYFSCLIQLERCLAS
jgi:hypothetical protein